MRLDQPPDEGGFFYAFFYAIRSGRHRSTFDATAGRKLAVFWIAVFQLESSEKLGLQSHTVETKDLKWKKSCSHDLRVKVMRAFNPLAAI
ncbi:MAG: hypothetical protein VXX31_12535 [Planctomycetota bacterium]|nr:hypothetical protein [Planctomycetota bacterium]